MENCIFCKIINKEIDSEFIYEDEYCLAFKDINPKAKTHVLLVTREHIPTLNDVSTSNDFSILALIYAAKKISKKLELPGYKFQINVGKEGGQEIFHLHAHLMSNY